MAHKVTNFSVSSCEVDKNASNLNFLETPPPNISLWRGVDFDRLKRTLTTPTSCQVDIQNDEIATLSIDGVTFGVGSTMTGCLVTWNPSLFTYITYSFPQHVQHQIPLTGTPWVLLQHQLTKNVLRVMTVMTVMTVMQNSVNPITIMSLCTEAAQTNFSSFGCIIGGMIKLDAATLKILTDLPFSFKYQPGDAPDECIFVNSKMFANAQS